ncbi:MAG: MBL fold metallo-hydrolase [Burkholderiaceae bacterium]|nr:MBL fold metallo-hydrolase [Burkholderiaceae bacterium]
MRRLLRWITLGLLALVLAGVTYVWVQANRRPSLEGYAQVPPAPAGAAIRIRYAGVATLLFDDGQTAWMTDGFFTRPSLARTAFLQIEPDPAAIEAGLRSLGVDRLAAVVPVHSHYDHAMDAPLVAMQTGALLVGSESTLNVGRGLGLPDARMRRVQPGEQLRFGRWTLTFIASSHVPLPFARAGVVETIDAPLVPPAHSLKWREGQTWAIVVEHPAGAPMLVLGSAGFIPGGLQGVQAGTVFLGVGGAGKQPPAYLSQWWDESVKRVGAKRVIPIHWDDFGEPLDKPLLAFPYLIDDLGVTMKHLTAWAARDRVELKMPLLLTPFAP